MRRIILCVPILACLLTSIAPAAERPDYYVRKGTWFETMAASHLAAPDQPDIKAIAAAIRDDFPDPESLRQLNLETQALVWNYRGPTKDLRRWAQRYVAGTQDRELIDRSNKARTVAEVAAVRQYFYRVRLADAIDLVRRTLVYVEKQEKRPKETAELGQLAKWVEAANETTDCVALFTDICRLRRRLILSHPALAFEKLLLAKHAPGKYSHNCDQYLGRHSRPGDGLVVLTDWQDKPKTSVLLADKLPHGDAARPNLSYDAKKILFTFCDHTKAKKQFFIYEAAIDGSWVRQLTGTPGDPLATWGDRKTVDIEDFDPSYLPDGGFVFTSTRSQCFGRCHGGRYTPSYLIYRADAGGKNIRQISYGEANEHFPNVLHDGRVVFTRWEYINRNQIALHKLWWCRPDGTLVSNFYGSNSATPWAIKYHDSGRSWNYDHLPAEETSRVLPYMLTETRPIPNSSKVVATAQGHHSYTAGSLVIIDPDVGDEGFDPLNKLTPETPYGEAEDYFQAPGNYMTPWPINEELFLAAYSPYNIPKQRTPVPTNDYMIYLVDSVGGREPIYADGSISCMSPMPILPRKCPPALSSTLPKQTKQTGTLIVQDVYLTRHDPEGLIKRGDIKYLRINEILPQPKNGSTSAGSREDFARKILGTVPVNEDGSASFEVPARTPIHLQALDANGMAVLTERSLMHVMPGEVRTCIGCHESRGTPARRKFTAMNQPPSKITPPVGPQYEGGFSFLRTVQPVLDRYCIRCHGLEKTEGDVNLLGGYQSRSKTQGMPPLRFDNTDSYSSLTTKKGVVKMAHRKSNDGPDSETFTSRPKDYFAHASKLAPMLMKGHGKGKLGDTVKLDPESFQRIVDWLDMNCIRYGDYRGGPHERARINGQGEKALREFIAHRFGKQFDGQPIQALINVAQPNESRILQAPLPTTAGGWGQIPNGYKSTDAPDYRKMQELVQAAAP